jgi:integrase
MKLTDKTCKNAKPSAKPRKLTDGDGLYLEVMPSGSKYWRLKYRFAGREKRLALGVYPQVSLAEARAGREAARKLLASGTDPSFAKQERKRQLLLNADNTFEAIAREWHQHNIAKWKPDYGVIVLGRLEADIFPEIGKLPIKEINAPRLLKAIQEIEKRGAHEVARRGLQTCGQVFQYALITGRAERNPAIDLKGALKPYKKHHYAALDAKDIPEFLQNLKDNKGRLHPLTHAAVELIMLTFVRTSELIKAKWEEFNLDETIWIIPAARMKMRREHIVPLSDRAIEILKEVRRHSGNREYVFPGQKNPQKHMSNNTILEALARMGYRGRATGHGFRALAMSTIKEKLNYRHEVIDRQLAHAHRNSIDAAYDRAEFLPERRKMMQEWADYLNKSTIGKVIFAEFSKGKKTA